MFGKLIALSKNGEEKGSLPVVNLHFFIGSDLFCDLRINHKDIAAQHCLITSQKNKLALIRNLSRTVPTLVNSTEIGSSDVELKDNDIITIRHKNYKWCYDSSSKPSTSSQTSFVVTSKNRKSWPLFKNKLVAVVTPQRRDEQNEIAPKKRRGTIAEENVSKSKSTPKVLAIKSGLRATTKQNLGKKRKPSVKNSQNIAPIERTPKVLPSLNRKSVKFLDMSAPCSRLGTRGRKSSYATPYKCTPTKQKVSVYSTPSSLFRRDKTKPIKSILKTPSSSSTPRNDEYDEQRLLSTSDILATPMSNVPVVSLHSPSLFENELLQTPTKGNQPEIVMRSSRRKAAIIRSPPSTPKSITKKRKSPEEKSIEASERAAKKLKKEPPHAIDKKKRAALLQCHRKSLTPHPVARRSGKLITSFPSSFSRRLEINSPARTKFSPKYNNSRKSESLEFSTDSLTPNVFKFSSLGKHTDSEILHNITASQEKIKSESRKKSIKSISKMTFPFVRKFTRASRAARISNNSLPQKMEATDVLSALDLSRRWPSPLQEEVCANSSSHDESNLSGFKKLFSVDKTLDVRELFLEKNSESDIVMEKSFQSIPETHLGRVSRRSAVLKGKQFTDNEEFMHSFQSEGAQDLPCSTSLLSGSLSSFRSYSSTSRRSLSLKRGRQSSLSHKDTKSSLVEQRTEEQQSNGRKTTQSSDNVENIKTNSPSVSRKGRRTLSTPNRSSFENNHLMQLSKSSSSNLLNITNETHKNSVDTDHFSSPMNDTLSRSNFGDCNVSLKGLDDSSSDVSVFSLGSFNSSYHKSRCGDSLSLSQACDVNAVDKKTFLENSVNSGNAKDVCVLTPESGKVRSKGRIFLRKAILLASTPKPGKVLSNNESFLSLEGEIDTKETSIHDSGSNKLQIKRSLNLSTDVSSGKLKKLTKKGKGFIAKASSRFASLPLRTDSSILKDLSPISISVGDLRTSRRNKVNWNRSQLNSLKSTENLINNNMDSSVTAISSIQSTSHSKSRIADHSHEEVEPKQVLTSYIFDSPRRSHRKTEDSKIFNQTQIDNLFLSPPRSSDKKHSVKDFNATLQVSLSSSKHYVEPTQLEVLAKLKKGSRNVPSSTDDQINPKQALNILKDSGHHRLSSRKTNDSKIFNKTQIDSSSLSFTRMPDKISIKEDDASPSISTFSSVNYSLGKSGRISKLSIGSSQSTMKKRSRSLPSLPDEQTFSISENFLHLSRSIRKEDDSKVLNKTHIDTSSSSPSTSPNKTASGKVSSNASIGRRGRPSKLSVGPDNSQLEKSIIIKKRSRSLPSSSEDPFTPKHSLSILEDSGRTRRTSRKGDDGKVLSKTHTDTSSSSSTSLSNKTAPGKEGDTTPIIKVCSNISIGRRGRPSKLSVGTDDSQLEKSTILIKRSRSLPTSPDNQVTPKEVSSVVEDSGRTRSSRKGGDGGKVLNKTHIDTSSSLPSLLLDKTASGKEGDNTPIIKVSSNTSIEKRGRPSKLSMGPDNSQLEKSTILKKRSPSSSDNQVTPKQVSSVVEDSGRTRSSRKGGDGGKVLNKTHIDTSSSLPSLLLDKTASGKEGDNTPIIKVSSNTSIEKRGRPSKLSMGPDNSQLEKSTILKKQSLPSSSDNQVTPKQVSSVVEDSGRTRSSRKGGDGDKVLNKTLIDTTSSSPSLLLDKTGSGKEGDNSPIIKVSSNTSIEKRGRPSKLSMGPDNSQLEESIILKKRSRSLPSSSDNQVTSKQVSSVVEDSGRTRSSRKGGDGDKVLNKTLIDTTSSSPSLLLDKTASSKEGDNTPIIKVSSNTSIGRRGRLSKLNMGSDNSQLEKSTILKKRSRSLPSSYNQATPQQVSSVVEDSGRTRSNRKGGDGGKVLNKTHIDTYSSSPSLLLDKTTSGKEGDNIPVIKVSSNTSKGRRGRPSKLSMGPDNTQLEKSNHSKGNSRIINGSKIFNETQSSYLSSSPAILPDDKTPTNNEVDVTLNIYSSSSINNSLVKRGRSSKLSVSLDKSQLEESTTIEKLTQSLPFTPYDQTTLLQALSISENYYQPKRSTRKGNYSKIFQVTQLNSSSSPTRSSPRKRSNVNVAVTQEARKSLSIHSRIGKRGRLSKLSIGPDNSLLEKMTIVKKPYRSLPSSSDDHSTPKQASIILEDSDRSRQSSRKGDDGKVLNKTNMDVTSSSPSLLLDKTASGKEGDNTPIIKVSSNTSIEKRGRSSKLSMGPDNSQLEKSTILKKRSRSLPSSSDNQVTPKQVSSVVEDSGRTRSSRKGDDGKVLNKTHIDTSFSSPSALLDRTPSDEEVYATPNISTLSLVKTSCGKRGRPSKLSLGPDNSQLKSSAISKRHSQSLAFLSDDHITPKDVSSILEDSGRTRRNSGKGDDGKVLNNIHVDNSSSSPSTLLERAPSDKEVYATPKISILSSVKTSIGKQSMTSKLSIDSGNSQLEKYTIVKKHLRSLPSLTTSEQAFIIPEDSGHRRRSSRKRDDNKILNKTHIKEKSKKRKVEEVSPEPDPMNISSLAKKKVKISNSDCFSIFSDNVLNNKRTNFLDTNAGNSKTFSAFSSTPIVTKKPYLVDSCGEKNRSRSKFRNIQSPMGLSPIIGSNEADSSVNDESSQISMVCLRHSKCPSDIGERSKSDSLTVSSNLLAIEENRSHNSIDLGVTDCSNYGTNNSKIKLSKKTAVNLSTTQNELPFINQTPITSQLPTVKEDKSLQLPPQVRKSDYSIHSLQESKKEEMVNITSRLRSKTPVIKLSPGKSKTRSRKIVKDIESIEEKKLNTIIHKTSFVEEIIDSPKPVSDNYLNKREAKNPETCFQNELSSNSKRPLADHKFLNSFIISPKTSDQNVLTVKFPVPKRRGRPPKLKDISEMEKSINKVLPVSRRRGRSAKNINLSPPLVRAETTLQKTSRKKKGKKGIVAEDPSSSSKEHEVENFRSESDQKLSKKELKTSISFPKTRSKVAVLALKTPRKSVLITSSIVKSPSLNATSEDMNVILLRSISANEEIKRKKNKVKNSSPLQKHIKIEKTNINLPSPVKRRGRSAVNNSPSRREKAVGTISKQDHVATSPHMPKRGRPIKIQENVINISTKRNDLNEVIEEPSTLSSQKRGRSVVKKSYSSPNKKGKPKKDHPVNNNKTVGPPSLPKKGRSAEVQDSNLYVSDRRTVRKTSASTEDENTSLRRGRSVVKNSDSCNKKGKPKNDHHHPVNNNETIDSPSLPKKGKPAKVQDSKLSVSDKRTARKTSENTDNENISLRRGRSAVENFDFSRNKKEKSEKDRLINNNEKIASTSLSKKGRPAKVQYSNFAVSDKRKARKTSESTENKNNSSRRGRPVVKNSDSALNRKGNPKKDHPVNSSEMIASPSLPKRGRPAIKIQDRATTDSRKKPNRKDSEIEEVRTNVRRGRSAVKDQHSPPDKRKKLITLQSESDANFNVDSTLPKSGKSAKRTTRKASESTDDQSTLPLQKRGRSSGKNSESSVNREKSKKEPTINNVAITSPSFPKRGRSAKLLEGAVTASVKGTSISSQRRGRSAAVDEHSVDTKEKSKQDIEKNSVAQISSSSKKRRPAVLENISPRTRGRSVPSKQTSPLLLKKGKVKKSVTTEKTLMLPGRRGNLASSPQPEIRKVSERSKVIKKSSKIKDNRPLKSAIKKSLSKRLSRKSSLMGFINPGRRKVHFNKYVARNSNSVKK